MVRSPATKQVHAPKATAASDKPTVMMDDGKLASVFNGRRSIIRRCLGKKKKKKWWKRVRRNEKGSESKNSRCITRIRPTYGPDRRKKRVMTVIDKHLISSGWGKETAAGKTLLRNYFLFCFYCSSIECRNDISLNYCSLFASVTFDRSIVRSRHSISLKIEYKIKKVFFIWL